MASLGLRDAFLHALPRAAERARPGWRAGADRLQVLRQCLATERLHRVEHRRRVGAHHALGVLRHLLCARRPLASPAAEQPLRVLQALLDIPLLLRQRRPAGGSVDGIDGVTDLAGHLRRVRPHHGVPRGLHAGRHIGDLLPAIGREQVRILAQRLCGTDRLLRRTGQPRWELRLRLRVGAGVAALLRRALLLAAALAACEAPDDSSGGRY